MNTSPLQFARDFAKLKSDLASQPSHDLRLLRLVAFWPDLERHRDNKAYQSYFDEYIPLLRGLISEENLHDLTLEELQHILETLRSVDDAIKPDVCGRQMSTSAPMDDRSNSEIHTVALQLAKMLFYVGRIEEGIGVIADLIGIETCSLTELNDLDSFSELGGLRILCERIETGNPQLYQTLKQIVSAWEYETQSLSHEQANCLFVEKGDHLHSKPRVGAGLVSAQEEGGRQAPTLRGDKSTPQREDDSSRSEPLRFRHDAADVDICQPQNKATDGCHPERSRRAAQAGIHNWRGRMRTLTGSVETRKRSSREKDIQDHLAFDNQVKSSDDPFVGVVYDSFQAVRCLLKSEGMKDKSSASYHAHFSIKDSTHTFTGDSIGLAAALVTYTQLLKPDVTRLERFITSEVAFTGGISPDGQVTAVNEATLAAKITRAFFSPVKYLVLPEGNIVTAKQLLKQLRQRYPLRRLHLVAAERLSDVIENHNVVRPQRVCIGEYVVRKVSRYSRTAKIQVPLLVALLLVLLAILFPKWTPWFDWHIAKIEIIGNRFRTLNADGQELWVSGEFERPLDPRMYSPAPSMGREVAIAADVNGNGRDELFFAPFYSGQKSWRHTLRFYNDDATFKREVSVIERTRYPGDDENAGYCTKDMSVIVSPSHDHFILTGADCSLPSRCQFMLFDTAGNKVSGPYLHTGCLTLRKWTLDDIDGDGDKELIVGNTNNRYNRAALFVLNPMKLSGVSPPYDNELFLSSDMPKGSQLYYVAFPETPLSAGDDIRNGAEYFSYDPVSKSWEVHVREGIQLQDPPGVIVIYRLDSNFIPEWAVFGDGHFKTMSDWQAQHRLPLRETRRQMEYHLVDDVIVYHGDSIVHHPAAGIHFYSR